MKRRRALAAVAGITSLAGCSSMKAVVRSGPPYFEEVSITGANEVAVGEGAGLKLSARNTGGQAGDFTTTLTVGKDAVSVERSVTIEGIPVGEKKTTTVDPITLPYAGEYTFRITDHGAEHVVTAEAATTDLGESISVADLTLQVGNPAVLESMLTEEYGEYKIASPPGVFLVLDVLADRGSGSEKPSPNQFTVGGETPVDVQPASRSWSREPYAEVSSESAGYLIFETERSALDGRVEVKYKGNRDSDPDVVWDTGTIPAPKITANSVTTPNSVELDEVYKIGIRVTNDGDAAGIFVGILEVARGSDGGEWEPVARFQERVKAGATKSLTPTIVASQLDQERYRVRTKSGIAFQGRVSVTPISLAFGQTYPFNSSFDVSVLSMHPELADSVKTGGSNGVLERSYEADQGYKFLLAKVRVEYTGGDEYGPDAGFFGVSHDGNRYSADSLGMYSKIKQPVQGDRYKSPPTTQDETRSGWIVVSVPTSVDLDSAKIHCLKTGADGVLEGAIWQNE